LVGALHNAHIWTHNKWSENLEKQKQIVESKIHWMEIQNYWLVDKKINKQKIIIQLVGKNIEQNNKQNIKIGW